MAQANKPAELGDPELARKQNRGRFRPDDPRINRAGRLRLATRQAREELPLSGKLMTLFVPERHLGQYLTCHDGPWLVNLPKDFRIVAARLDCTRLGVVLTMRSEQFAPVQAGEPIPEFQGSYRTMKDEWESLLRKK
jgi:hypothetical protein